jgi:hypothetical protein
MSDPKPATEALVRLAVETRSDDWPERDIRGALAAARTAGLTWPQVLAAFGRLMADPKAHPRELVPDSRSPLASKPRLADEAVHRHAAAARAALQGDQDHD